MSDGLSIQQIRWAEQGVMHARQTAIATERSADALTRIADSLDKLVASVAKPEPKIERFYDTCSPDEAETIMCDLRDAGYTHIPSAQELCLLYDNELVGPGSVAPGFPSRDGEDTLDYWRRVRQGLAPYSDMADKILRGES